MANELMAGLLQSLLQPSTRPQELQNEGVTAVNLLNQPYPGAAAAAYRMPAAIDNIAASTRSLFGLQQPQTATSLLASNPDALATSAGMRELALKLKDIDPASAVKLTVMAQATALEEKSRKQAEEDRQLERQRIQTQIEQVTASTATPEEKEARIALLTAQAAEAEARTRNLPEEARLRARELDLQAQRIAASLEEAKLRSQELDVRTRERVNEASDEALTRYTDASNLIRVADLWVTESPTPGILGSVKGKWREFMGQQGGEEAVRVQYNQLLASGIAASLPPGAASDADVQLAKSGWLSDASNPDTVASFMRGMATLAALAAEQADLKSKFILENKTQAGFLDVWREKTQEEGFDRFIAEKYGIPGGANGSNVRQIEGVGPVTVRQRR